MKPPMYAPPSFGSKPQEYLHRARMFRDATHGQTAYVNNETNWPVYAHMLHACELALKAFCDQAVANGAQSARAPNHDLQGWYDLARQYGLPADPHVADGINVLNEIHKSHFTRYPSSHIRPRDLSISSDVVEALIDAATSLIHRHR
jgi:hypothetical protein